MAAALAVCYVGGAVAAHKEHREEVMTAHEALVIAVAIMGAWDLFHKDQETQLRGIGLMLLAILLVVANR